MTTIQDHYRNAPHYDYEYRDLTADIEFNVGLAKDFAPNGKILEFCAGTGRITLPLVNAGFNVTGVDITPAMLNIARQKASLLPMDVQERLQLIDGDMRNVTVGHSQFDLALIPFNSFMHMTTPQDQLAALTNAYKHLKAGGYFMADIFLPNVERLARNMGPSWIDMEKVMAIEEEGITLIRSGSFGYIPHQQLVTATWIYQIFESKGDRKLLNTYWSPFEIRVVFPGEWELLLEKAGFNIVEKWGSFDRASFGEQSGRMLFLCQK